MAILLTFLQKQFIQIPSVWCVFQRQLVMGQTLEILAVNENNWKSVQKFTSHSFVIFYQTSKISFVEEFLILSPIGIPPVLFSAGDTHISIVLIYQPPSRIVTFIADLIEALHSLLVHYQTEVLGGSNIDQRL